jgi:hypothetical protein
MKTLFQRLSQGGLALFMVSLSALACSAQNALNAATFQELTEGRSFLYLDSGQPYGAEEYLPNRQVRWSFLNGQCVAGFWYPQEDAICFVYEGLDGPQCWRFSLSEAENRDKIIAHYLIEGDHTPTATRKYEMESSSQYPRCTGPGVGV